MPEYNYANLNSGVYSQNYVNFQELQNQNDNVLFYDEGLYGSVSVVETVGEEDLLLVDEDRLRSLVTNFDEIRKEIYPLEKEVVLKINGRTQCGSGKLDLTTTTLLAAIPLAFHDNPKTALNIGLGCGLTYSSLRTYDLDLVDNIEIDPTILATYEYFDFVNNIPVEDMVSKVHVKDARSFLLLNDDKYDIIINEPAPPWMRESSRTFSKEFLELLRDHLNDDGLVSQWVFANQMIGKDGNIESFKIFYKTFDEVFPYNVGFISRIKFPISSHIENRRVVITDSVDIFGEMIFIGSKKPISLDDLNDVNSGMRERFDRFGISNIEDYYVFNANDLEGFVEDDIKINTDDNAVIEFTVAKNMYYTDDSSKIVDEIYDFVNS